MKASPLVLRSISNVTHYAEDDVPECQKLALFSTQAIHKRTQAIQKSTQAIQKSTQSIQKSTASPVPTHPPV